MKRITDQALIRQYLRQVPLTEYFDFDITPFLSVVQFESGETILKEGTVPASLYYMIDGRAKLFLTHENGRISLINFLDGPCFIGEMEFIGAQEYSNGITAITLCTCFAMDVHSCRTEILEDKTFLRNLCLFLGRKAIGNTYNYSCNQSYPLNVRLAHFILLTAHGVWYRETHTEAAEFLGVSYRHFLYVLAGLVRSGVLEKTEQGYRIRDKAALEILAAPFFRT